MIADFRKHIQQAANIKFYLKYAAITNSNTYLLQLKAGKKLFQLYLMKHRSLLKVLQILDAVFEGWLNSYCPNSALLNTPATLQPSN